MIMNIKDKGIYIEAEQIFTDYLKNLGFRKTEGRYDILKEIYSLDEHFEVEALYLNLKNKNFHISRATIYNTVELLLECGLITKHSFGTKAGSYEKSYGTRKHDHLICIICNEVIEFEDPKIEEIKTEIGNLNKFDITHYSFTMFGSPQKDETGKCKYCKRQI